jgi:hypothetical protein
VQDPSPQCCCIKVHHLTSWKNRIRASTTRGGLTTSAIGLPLTHARVSPHQPHQLALQIRLKDCRQDGEQRYSTPKDLPRTTNIASADRPQLIVSPAHRATSTQPWYQGSRLHRHQTLCHTRRSRHAEQTTAIHCKPSRSSIAIAASVVLRRCPTLN